MFKLTLSFFFTVLLLAEGPVHKTGQTTVYKAGDDGTYQAGTARSFSRSSAGVVTDNVTGLQWQDDAVGSTMNWVAAGDYCSTLALDGGGWRLPTQRELLSISDLSRVPAIDTTFLNTTGSYYWSSTNHASDPSLACGVGFNFGFYGWVGKADLYDVRCVRGGQI